ncbi:flagellar protein FlgN [Tumebacillus flagellatus]|uniref:Flagellar biosynthesis protein FlgN n=1 Tax=Tumebacillus flagellatus TaxID=1157490 RepID=A0A074LTV5_9BACL|nr:flagellar protein FlgN [Tumebacillus flagellatus]KEO84065.1 hypothetical protein EL26_06270 [Tumebacillus flagellatus]
MSGLKPICNVIQSLLQEHEALLKLSQLKRDSLIKGDIETLNLLVQREMKHIPTIDRLEKERAGLVRLYALRVGASADDMTAEKLHELSKNDPEASTLQELTARLRKVLFDLKDLNEQNKLLLDQSMQLVDLTIELLTQSPSVPTYGDSGESNSPYQTGRTSFFDSKA